MHCPKCLAIRAAIVVKGHTNWVSLNPYWYSEFGQGGPLQLFRAAPPTPPGVRIFDNRSYLSSGIPGREDEHGEVVELSSFWLYGVVHGANVILTSSDLSRVKVRRVDPTSGKTAEMIFDLNQEIKEMAAAPPSPTPPGVGAQTAIFQQEPKVTDLRLRDGDIIEIPEKE